MEEIKNWLDGERNYTEGVKLYVTNGKNNSLKRFFLMKDNTYSHEKLAYELEKIIEGVESTLPTGEETKPKEGVESTLPTGEETKPKEGVESTLPIGKPEKSLPSHLVNQNYPADLAEMVIERGALTNKKGKLANTLSGFKIDDNDGRKAVMEEIAAIRERINIINETERYFIKNRKMPTVIEKISKPNILTDALPSDKAQLLQLKKTLTEMRSKAKSKIAKTGEMSPEGQKLAIKIANINERYEAVEKLLTSGQ